MTTKRVKAGNGQAAAAARRGVFVQAYIFPHRIPKQRTTRSGLPLVIWSRAQRRETSQAQGRIDGYGARKSS